MDIAKLLGGIDLDDVRKVAQLATQLPGMMSEFGDKLADAGGQARTAATALGGLGDRLGNSGATARGFAAMPPAV